MANRGQGASGSWKNRSRMEASSSKPFPQTGSEKGMRYLEGENWSEIWKTMLIQDDDDYDDDTEVEEEEEEEQSRTMMIMDGDYDDHDHDHDHDHGEDEVGCNDERIILREPVGIQRAQSERYLRHIGGHRPTRARWTVIPQQYEERRGENHRLKRAHSSVIPQIYNESSSLIQQQYDESRGQNFQPILAHSSVIPQQYDEGRGESKRLTRDRSSVISQRYDENHRDNFRPTRAQSSAIQQQYQESRRESYRLTRASSVIPQQYDEGRRESKRLTRDHSSVIPQRYDENGGQNFRPTRASSAIPQQYHESQGENHRPMRTRWSVIPQQYDESRRENYRLSRAHSSVIPQKYDEGRGENFRPTQASSVTPQQYEESRGENYRLSRAHSSVIPQKYNESQGENFRPTRTRSVIPQQNEERPAENHRPTRTRWSVIPQQYEERRGKNTRSLSLQRPLGGRLKETNWQSYESTETRQRRSKSRQTEGANGDNDDNRTPSSVLTCKICFTEEVPVLRSCCSFPICHSCFDKYLTTQIDDGKTRINCPNYECRSVVPFEEIIQTVDSDRKLKLERLASKTLRKKGFKACPQCNAITVASETLLSKAKQEKSTFKVTCPVCELEWCYDCETPWHMKSTCENVKSNDRLFKEWTKRYSDSERSEKNARKCPKCKVYIQKNTGCDKMICRWCGTKFCYRCGRRIGSSTHHCFDFLPNLSNDKGTIFLMVLLAPLAIPAIVAVAAVSLPILIGYGGYKLVKAARRRPSARTRRGARE